MSALLVRRFEADVHQVDARTVTGRLAPYGVVADVADITDAGVERYREGFLPGAFAAQAQAHPNTVARITFVDGHSGGLGKMGFAVGLREQEDGIYGDLRVLRSRQTDIEDMLEAGVKGLSVGFHALATRKDRDGVRWRVRAHMAHVALVSDPAYADAEVLALRGAVEDAIEEIEDKLAIEEAARRERSRVLLAEAEALIAHDPWAHLKR